MSSTFKLLKGLQEAGTYKFHDSDTEELYNKNLTAQPIEWPWRGKDVTYTLNSNSFRAPEFDTVSWGKSIILLGCSFTFGVGVDDSETLAACIERRLNKPVVNLGIPGGSSMHMWALTTQLTQYSVRPHAIVSIHPPPHRVGHLGGWRHGRLGAWSTPEEIGPWVDWGHAINYSILSNKSCQAMMPGVPTSTWTWNEPMSKHAPEFKLLHTHGEFARDLKHPGPKTLDKWADLIVKDLF